MPRIPTATYRLQLHADFGFDCAADIADYLQSLGISHVYSSPYLQAAPGSKHGYDVVDHHRVNDELGGSEAHARFSRRLGEFDLGQVLDIVPNHMAISGRHNRLWWDVLENGPSSRYAPYFDINWKSREQKLQNKMLVPILADRYGRVLARGEIQLARREADFYVKYFDNELPLSPRSHPAILNEAAETTGSDYLAFLADSLSRLPSFAATDPASKTARHRDKTIIGKALRDLFSDTPFIAEAVDKVLWAINRDIDRLDAVLENQNFRLASWQTAAQDLPYRRFFDVNTLVALSLEKPEVFTDTHALILRWLREGVLDGVRIDHPDGLRDPRQYFDKLREGGPDAWIVAEKILEPGETLRPEWPIQGTTGYDYLNQVAGLFVDSRNEAQFNKIYSWFTRESVDYAAVSRDKKHRVLRDLLGSDVNRLTTLLTEICGLHRDQRDFTRHDVIRALRELVACFPIYRTYVVPDRNELTDDDIRYTDQAIEAAKRNRPELDVELFNFIRDLILLRVRGELESEFVMRFQQFCSPAMAKGVEDTAFYNYNRLVSLNEVGGDPGRFGVSVNEYHAFCAETQQNHPSTMLSTSTHDTKRSEEVRLRISVLSEMPDQWEAALKRWSGRNERHKTSGFPDPNTEYFLYQTMLGAWPISADRLLPYLEKATREAKCHTSWLSPNEQFESATVSFVKALYADPDFIQDLESLVARLTEPGWKNSLSQTLLKFTSPGIPDTYQGEEIWDLSLVDPDNRRPVDYNLRRRLLGEVPSLDAKQVWSRRSEGLPKLWTIHHALRVRRAKPKSFGSDGAYGPIEVTGPKAPHLVAFRRGEDVLVIAPRLNFLLNDRWDDASIALPPGDWNNVLAGQAFSEGSTKISDILREFPVALLIKNN